MQMHVRHMASHVSKCMQMHACINGMFEEGGDRRKGKVKGRKGKEKGRKEKKRKEEKRRKMMKKEK